jgi:pimeloyl-[acyl-carrier protein] methyl ester esterase
VIEASLPQKEPYILLAESFSGPLALRALGAIRDAPVALILCASFGRSPVSKAASLVLQLCAEAGLPRLPIPTWLIRRYLLGDAPESVIQSFRRALTQLSNPALASRFKVLAEYNADFVPTKLALPILYIQAGQDRLVHKRELVWLQDRFPHIDVGEVDSPHFVLQARPHQSLQLILKFLQEQGMNQSPN